MMHSLKYITARGGMVLKLDTEKAYDRMDYGFVEETLFDAGLPSWMINTIMSIIMGSRFRLL